MSTSLNPERVDPTLLGGAQSAARSFGKITDRIAALQGAKGNSLQREADARELRLIAESATSLARALG